MTEHQRMIKILLRSPKIIAAALHLNSIWIRSSEYPLCSGESIDLLFQNKWNAYRTEDQTTCYVLELKSEEADHAILGQLQKYVDAMTAAGKSCHHWHTVVGVAVAKSYTDSCRQLLKNAGYVSFIWTEVGGVVKLEE